MKKIKRRLFIISIIFALLAAATISFYLESLNTVEEVKIETYTILVASQNIPSRTEITENMIKEIEVSFESKSAQFLNDFEDIVGLYVKNEIFEDSKFHKDNLMNGKNEELSVKISGNMRAVSIGINGNTGVANLIKPGDNVDVVVYLPKLEENQMVVRPDIVKILLQNIEVLAIDQDLIIKKDLISEEKDDSQKYYIATLAVPVMDVERLVFAKDVGMLELVLRPIDGDYLYQTEGVIWQELLIDDFDRMKDMFPNYEVNNVGEVYIDPDEIKYDEYIYYTVKFGDTLREISLLFYGNEENYLLLKEVNHILDENVISSGMGIKIPVLEDRGIGNEEN